MAKIYNTPGVYIEEKNAFPNSVVHVPTAIPAFVSYTEKATSGNKNLTHQAIRISSLGEFVQFFGEAPKITFGINKADTQYGFELSPDSTPFLLFNSLKFFYANGGGDCYIVSIGNYKDIPKKEDFFSSDDKHPAKGITCLEKVSEPTMLVIPDALLLDEVDCQSVQKEMLKHCGSVMRNRVAILDVYNGYRPRTKDRNNIIDAFRNGIGNNFLSYGMTYYPWCHTSITEIKSLSFENINANDLSNLVEILNKDIDQSIKAGHLTQLLHYKKPDIKKFLDKKGKTRLEIGILD
jgi:hypothetical protein